MLPLVSIGIPNFNGSKYIIRTLESVKEQTYKNIELLVVDDASTDNSVWIIEDWIYNNPTVNARLIQHKQNLGPCQACQTFFQHMEGEFFQYVGSDDILEQDKITQQLAAFAHLDNEYAFIYSDAKLIDSEGKVIHSSYLEKLGFKKNSMPEGFIFDELLYFNFIQSCSPLIRRKAALAVGGFNTKYWLEDYDLWLRLSQKYKVAYIPEALAQYRVHSTSITNNSITWARTIDEALHMRFKFYNNVNKKAQQNIADAINKDAPALYAFDYKTAEHWLKINFFNKSSLKNLLLFILCKLGIKFSSLAAFKAFIKKYI